MIVLFTDFSFNDPYVGQLHAALAREAPGEPVVDLFHGLPAFDIQAAAYLLPAYAEATPSGTVCLAVVDPGVGGPREAVMLKAGGRWYVGPDNGLFTIVARRAPDMESRRIVWRPPQLSVSFHARDLFAPCAARLARGALPDSKPWTLTPPDGPAWPDDLPKILYIDHYGNGLTGLRAATVSTASHIEIHGRSLAYARVFGEVPAGEAFWYENANGLVEIAINQGHAASRLGFAVGDAVRLIGADRAA